MDNRRALELLLGGANAKIGAVGGQHDPNSIYNHILPINPDAQASDPHFFMQQNKLPPLSLEMQIMDMLRKQGLPKWQPR